ncbi:hypothetical protein [Actinocrispum sp. NPDC049592]|uniref:hypothetical protein n=1 Tax=Actinocrispum sp. NPDC049592 TaxID=3154835 RepID=UPI00341AE180
MTVDKAEMWRTGIGMLTLGHEAVSNGRDGNLDMSEVYAAYSLLRRTFTDFDLDSPPEVPADSLDATYEAITDVADMYSERLDFLLLGIFYGFNKVVAAYLEDCPGADIGAILRRVALNPPALN